MRVEPGEHAVDGVLDQVLVVDRIDVLGAHALEHVAEQRQQPVGVGAAAVLREGGVDAEIEAEMATDLAGGRADHDAGDKGGAEQKASAKAPGTKVHSFNPLIGHAPGAGPYSSTILEGSSFRAH